MKTNDFNIVIPDIGIGNIRSLSRAILNEKEFVNKLLITTNSKDVSSKSCIVFPGVGNYGEVMKRLDDTGWKKVLEKHINEGGIYVGICVGFQILFQGSEENNSNNGLNFLPFKIKKLKQFDYLPVIGYQNVFNVNKQELGKFYFIHSYGIEVTHKVRAQLGLLEYYYYYHKNRKILAGIKNKNLIGLQFHPEKSKISGVNFLNNTIKTMDFL